jgi:hypothetical protein
LKHKTRRRKTAFRNKLLHVFAALALTLACIIAYFTLNQQSQTMIDLTPKAAIVDHLSLTQPNPNFSQTTQAIIGETGMPVDYYPGEQVTVDFYRNLPLHNYKIIVFRVHSTGECSVEDVPPFVVFFTSEEYSNVKYISEQLDMRLVYVNFPERISAQLSGYFGVTPSFIKNSLSRNFNNTIIIAMGCDGLKYTSMAEAFIEKGAKVYIGWNGAVSAHHTDMATERLLRKLIKEKLTIKEAVKETMKEVGPDKIYNSTLTFYPQTYEAGNYVIQTSNFNNIFHERESMFYINFLASATTVSFRFKKTSKIPCKVHTTLRFL